MPTTKGHTTAIRAKKVIGTNVKDKLGQKIGQIEDIVLDKLSNNIMFAIVSFGGFLGIAEQYHPIPWSSLDYSKGQDSYSVKFTKDQLRAAPADSMEALTKDDGQAYRDRAFDYYKIKRYWQEREGTPPDQPPV